MEYEDNITCLARASSRTIRLHAPDAHAALLDSLAALG
jgi:hypothetical protein